ncbi:hypothetical protein Godav_025442 [Gossypium davidsonii]|uniref:DUF7745 domain-containing protein n=1 Tax=Gossypium davidsonii TaxID=34287 RepID=A0A7J8TJ63_GOSDV|nr:hypothetical protein [Gossypium davidsonii]
MKKGFLDKVEDNAAVRTWSEMTQCEKGDSLAEGYVSEFWDFTSISVTQNNLQELKEIWDHWNDEARHHFWKVDKVLYQVFSDNYSPLKEIVATPRRDNISEEKWIAILQNLQEEDIEWRAPWLLPDEILYRCGDFDWVPLLGIWGAVGYAPLLKLEVEKLRMGKTKAEEDLDSLKTDYKKLLLSMRTTGLGKTLE